MTGHEFYQLDVFTDEAFKGNPLAVFPDAAGIPEQYFQQIAAEMNLSETVFVLPSKKALRRLRIFTPRQELPLAGHPVVGTWNLLARLGMVPVEANGRVTIEQELNLGILPVEIEFGGSEPKFVTMTQGQFEKTGEISDEVSISRLAAALGLERDELAISPGLPVAAVSTGISALDVPVTSLTSLSRIRVDSNTLSEIYRELGAVGVYAFTFETLEDASSVHARFFAPADAIPEDPATGSAAGSLSGYLIHHGAIDRNEFVIEQGDFMGRPSRIHASVEGATGDVKKVRIGGRSAVVARGEVFVD